MYSRSQKKKRNVITLQKDYRKTTVRTTHVLYKTINRTTQNYRPYYTKLRYTDNTTDKLSACTHNRHKPNKLHTNPTQ